MGDNETDIRALKDDICGVTFIGSTGVEWICVKQVHNPEYTRNRPGRSGTRKVNGTGGWEDRGIVAPADKHYFVNRWPNRKINKND